MRPVHVRIGQTPDGNDWAEFRAELNIGVWSPLMITDPIANIEPIRCVSRNSAFNALARELCALGLKDRPVDAWGFDYRPKVMDWKMRYSCKSFVAQAKRSYSEGQAGISIIRWSLFPDSRRDSCPTCEKAAFMFKGVCVGCYTG
jgi:hypothetical protein